MITFDSLVSPEMESAQTEASVATHVTFPMPIAARLLDLLSSDDAYRARFESNPRAALLEIGHETPAAHLGVFGLDPVMSFGYFEGGLASKEQLAAARGLLLARDNPAIFGPFDMCAD